MRCGERRAHGMPCRRPGATRNPRTDFRRCKLSRWSTPTDNVIVLYRFTVGDEIRIIHSVYRLLRAVKLMVLNTTRITSPRSHRDGSTLCMPGGGPLGPSGRRGAWIFSIVHGRSMNRAKDKRPSAGPKSHHSEFSRSPSDLRPQCSGCRPHRAHGRRRALSGSQA